MFALSYSPFKNKKRGAVLFVGMSIVFLLTVIALYNSNQNSFINDLHSRSENDIATYKNNIESRIVDVASDLILIETLIESNESLLITGDSTGFANPIAGARIGESLKQWLVVSNIYDQIRIIDNSGMEIIRVNYNQGSPFIVAEESLQDKSGRYYFENSIILDDNQVYMSPLDLNIENNEIEIVDGKYKPMIRFATPINDLNGVKAGVLIINYLAENIFESLNELDLSEYSSFEVVNEDGYYLDAIDDSIEFGFMFDDGEENVVGTFHDFGILEVAKDTVSLDSHDDELYTIVALSENALSEAITENVGSDISVLAESGDIIMFGEIDYTNISQYKTLKTSYTVIAFLSVFVAFLIAKVDDISIAAKEERIKLLEYSNKHDVLTGIPNRASIFETIEYKLSRGYDLTVMFIDFDGFKNINDSFGHDVGDLALKEGVNRLRNSIRKDDVISRVGGDEFIVLLNNLAIEDVVKRIAKKMIQSFDLPFEFGDIKTKMGVSIGIAINKDSKDVEEVIKRADEAMYIVKNSTKNDFHIAE